MYTCSSLISSDSTPCLLQCHWLLVCSSSSSYLFIGVSHKAAFHDLDIDTDTDILPRILAGSSPTHPTCVISSRWCRCLCRCRCSCRGMRPIRNSHQVQAVLHDAFCLLQGTCLNLMNTIMYDFCMTPDNECTTVSYYHLHLLPLSITTHPGNQYSFGTTHWLNGWVDLNISVFAARAQGYTSQWLSVARCEHSHHHHHHILFFNIYKTFKQST